jgi:hypothetical protein
MRRITKLNLPRAEARGFWEDQCKLIAPLSDPRGPVRRARSRLPVRFPSAGDPRRRSAPRTSTGRRYFGVHTTWYLHE